MKIRPEIDGLRAVAIIPVLLYHGHLGLRGGFVGVDVFFVISGYLITALLLNSVEGGRFSMFDFWERRIRRIFPPLALVLLASLVAGWLLLLPHDLKMLGESIAAQALLLSNVLFSLQSGYFAEANEFTPLLHTWSLAIEEQFYLFWPLLLAALARLGRPRLGRVVLWLGLASFGLNLYLTPRFPEAAFYLLPGRTWELLVGAYLAIAPPPSPKAGWRKEALSAAGLVAVLSAMVFYGPETVFPGAAAAVPCLGTALVIWTNGASLSAVGRLLALRPLVFVGWISYSLYLWHWPLLAFGKYYLEYYASTPMGLGHRLGLLALALALAAATWKGIETPCRKGRILRDRKRLFAFALVLTAAFCLAGLAIYRTGGFPSRVSPEVQRADGPRRELSLLPNVTLEQARRGELVELGIGDPEQPVGLLLWGDSHAAALIPVFDALCKERRIRARAAVHYLTPPVLEPAAEGRADQGETPAAAFNSAVMDFVRVRKIQDVVLAAHWNRYLAAADGSAKLESDLQNTIQRLRETGVRIWIVMQVPEQRFDVPRALAGTLRLGRDADRIGVPLQMQESRAAAQRRLFARLRQPGVEVLDATPCFVNPFGLCAAVADGQAMYGDKSHLTAQGAMILKPVLERIFP